MTNPDFDKLMLGRFPELADALRDRCERIITRWRGKLVELLPEADKLTLKQLDDDIPILLEWLDESLRSGSPRPLKDLIRYSPTHGGMRFHQNFNLNEVMIEYHLLRWIMLEEVETQLKRPLQLRENVAINLGLDISLRRAAVEFVNHQSEQLKASAESHAKYLAFLSHDLRGGLNGVLLMIEVLHRDLSRHTEFAQSLDDLEVMKQAILDTVATMERFLHAERLRKGLFVPKSEPIDLPRFINDLCQQFAYQAKAKGIALEQKVPGDVSVTTDREVLSMILRNLISNAVKYTPSGKVKIEVANRGNGIRIMVCDEGPGIDKEQLGKIFAPYTRGKTHGQPGVGLGLSIARQGAELLHATMSAESEIGKGAVFYLDLPREPKGDH